MSPDPLTQDLYIMPLMGNRWHLWKAGHEVSVCGLDWSMAAVSFDVRTDTPQTDLCEECAKEIPP